MKKFIIEWKMKLNSGIKTINTKDEKAKKREKHTKIMLYG